MVLFIGGLQEIPRDFYEAAEIDGASYFKILTSIYVPLSKPVFATLALFYAGWMIYCSRKRKRNILSYVNMAVLFCFLIIMLTCPQAFNTAMYLLVLALFVRALSQGHFTYHKKR